MRRASLALALIVVLLAPVRGEGDDLAPALVLRTFDVGRLTRQIESASFEPFGIEPDGERSEFGDDEPAQLLQIDDLHRLLVATVEPESWGADGALLEVIGSRLVVRNDAKTVAKIAALLQALEAQLDRLIETRVRWMTFTPEAKTRLSASGLLKRASSGSLGLDDVRTLVSESLRSGNALESGSASGISGVRVAIRRLERVAFVEDYEVEVAGSARIADPDVATARAGLVVYVTPRIGLDDSITLEVVASAGRLQRPMTKTAIEARTHGRIDLPRFEQTYVTTTGRLVRGRTLATTIVRPHGPSGPALGVLLVDARAAPRPEAAGDLAIIDLGFLVRPKRSVRFDSSSELELSEREFGGSRPLVIAWSDEIAERDEILSTLQSDVGDELWTRGVHAVIVTTHGRLIVRHDARVIDRLRSTIAAWERAHRTTAQVDVRVYSVPLEAAATLSTGARPDVAVRTRLADSADVTERFAASLGTFSGRWSLVAAGVSQSYIRDYDAEIASGDAGILDPLIERFFDGAALHVQALESVDGSRLSVRLDLQLEWAQPESLKTASRRGDAKLGILQQPRSRRLHVVQTVSFPRGGLALIDGGRDPLAPDGSRRLIVVVGVE